MLEDRDYFGFGPASVRVAIPQHTITIERKSITKVSGLIPYCSCGWHGAMRFNENLAEQEGEEHVEGVRNERRY